MHPLSVEDVLFQGGHALSKADYYPKHLFIRVLCHTLGSTHRKSQGSKTAAGSAVLSPNLPFTELTRSTSPQCFDEKSGKADEGLCQTFYEDCVDPMVDELEFGRANPVDPEIGRHRASLLVRDLYIVSS